MKVFCISDLHFSFNNPKPMERFGDEWKNHCDKIEDNWYNVVSDSDIVLIAGDISWAMRHKDAFSDLEFIAKLPGRKVIIKGNHDYWWESVAKLRKYNFENMYFIQNDIVELDKIAISGTRLWDFPFINWASLTGGLEFIAHENTDPRENIAKYDHQKIQNREIERLKLCLTRLQKYPNSLRIILTHFPPIGPDMGSNIITELIEESKIDICVFGHLHNIPKEEIVDGFLNKVRYILSSCDYLNFVPKLVAESQ